MYIKKAAEKTFLRKIRTFNVDEIDGRGISVFLNHVRNCRCEQTNKEINCILQNTKYSQMHLKKKTELVNTKMKGRNECQEIFDYDVTN